MNRKSFLSSLLVGLAGFIPGSWRWAAAAMSRQPSRGSLGMYYTPTALLNRLLVCDPACGTGGFLVQANEQVTSSPR
jgi:hypothetical protein